MRLLYVTDLHGHEAKYRRVAHLAREHMVDLVVNGGDMLTKSRDMHTDQARFLYKVLEPFLAELDDTGIGHIGYLGNDDLRIFDEPFDTLCNRYPGAVNLAQDIHRVDEYEFIGLNWVDDYPFRLKDRCRLDTRESPLGTQLGTGLLSVHDGFEELEDWYAYVSLLPSIEQELDALPVPDNPANAIYVIHTPPANLGLDVCANGRTVGSAAVHRFIERRQPLLTLHGHIHESPDLSGVWQARLGRTTCIQPGQLRPLSCVVIELPSLETERILEDQTPT
jgi:Icc-related predicted phosphoesterase